MINALVASQAVRVPLALRRTAKARSKTRATASCAPKIVASSKGPSMGGNKKASTRGEELVRHQMASRRLDARQETA